MKVLSDPRRRTIYDQYGEDGLYGDVPPEEEDHFEEYSDEHNGDYDNFKDSRYCDNHPPPPPTSAPQPPPPPRDSAPQPPSSFTSDNYGYSSYENADYYPETSSESYYSSRPNSSTFYTPEYDTHSKSYDFASSRDSPPPSHSYSKPQPTHSNQPDPYDIFKRFFGTQDYKVASKAYVLHMHVTNSDGNLSFLDSYSSTGENTSESTFNPAAAAASMRDEELPVEPIIDKPIVHTLYCSLEDL